MFLNIFKCDRLTYIVQVVSKLRTLLHKEVCWTRRRKEGRGGEVHYEGDKAEEKRVLKNVLAFIVKLASVPQEKVSFHLRTKFKQNCITQHTFSDWGSTFGAS